MIEENKTVIIALTYWQSPKVDEKSVRFGSVGRKDVLTGNVNLSNLESSPICGRPMKRTIEIAAAHSFSSILT